MAVVLLDVIREFRIHHLDDSKLKKQRMKVYASRLFVAQPSAWSISHSGNQILTQSAIKLRWILPSTCISNYCTVVNITICLRSPIKLKQDVIIIITICVFSTIKPTRQEIGWRPVPSFRTMKLNMSRVLYQSKTTIFNHLGCRSLFHCKNRYLYITPYQTEMNVSCALTAKGFARCKNQQPYLKSIKPI